jgi:hypothetical protein
MIGVSGSDQFGYAVGRVGRLDSDDFDEFIIGAWKAPLPTAFCASQNGGDPRTALGGAAFVYSPGSTLTDKVIVKFYGEAFRDHLGRAVATWNLFGTDSFPEIVLSGPAHSDSDFVPEDEEIGRGYVWNGTDVLTPP